MMRDSATMNEWRRSWPLPFVGAVGCMLNAFHLYSLGVFVGPIEQATGWGRAEITFGLSITSILSLALIPVSGWLIDRHGPRIVAIVGSALYCTFIALLATTGSTHWTWWLLWGLLSFGSSPISPVLWTAAVASRFDKARGMALAITLCGSGLISIAAPLLANGLLEHFSWRGAYAGSGLIMAVVALPLIFGWFYGQADLDRRAGGAKAAARAPRSGLGEVSSDLKSSVFIRLALSGFLLMVAMSAFMVHFVPALKQTGLTAGEAAGAFAFVGVGSIAGRLLGGVLLDRVPATLLGAIAFMLPATVSLSMVHLVDGFTTAAAASFVLGLSLGCEMDVLAYLTSRLFGLAHFGTLFSVIIALTTVAYAIGPVVGGLLYEQRGDYTAMFMLQIPVLAVAALAVLSLNGTLKRTLRPLPLHAVAH